jgi:hypothetical protein
MRAAAPASYHLDFYRYWLAKRGALPIPLHRAIDPGEIPALVPYVGIIGRTGGELRYRLAGTALSAELGRDITGSVVGSYIWAEEGLRATIELVYSAACPVFNTGRYKLEASQHNVSALLLPLSEDGTVVNRVIFLRLARFQNFDWANPSWLSSTRPEIGQPAPVRDATHLEHLAGAWERACQVR